MKKEFVIPVAVIIIAAGLFYYFRRNPGPGDGFFEVSGTIESEFVDLGSIEGGRVETVLVKEGDQVGAGELMVSLDPGALGEMAVEAEASLRAASATLAMLINGYTAEEIQSARAAVSASRSRLEMLEKGSRQEQIDAARADYSAAKAGYENLVKRFERINNLYEHGVTPAQEVDNARTAMETAGEKMRSAEAVYEMAQEGPRDEEKQIAKHKYDEVKARLRRIEKGPRKEEIDKAEAAVERARAGLLALRERLKEKEIRAPQTCTVDVIDLYPGDLLAPGQTAVTALLSGELWVDVFVPQDRLGFVRTGAIVPIYVDSFPGRTFEGKVERIARSAEFTPRNAQTPEGRAMQVFRTRLTISDPDSMLHPGMTAIAKFDIAEE